LLGSAGRVVSAGTSSELASALLLWSWHIPLAAGKRAISRHI